MPGTHDLLEIVGETMCMLIEFDGNSMVYKINLEELLRLSSMQIEFSMNAMHGIVNFIRKTNDINLAKIVYENFHEIIFHSILEWKSLNHSFNLRVVSLTFSDKIFSLSFLIIFLPHSSHAICWLN